MVRSPLCFLLTHTVPNLFSGPRLLKPINCSNQESKKFMRRLRMFSLEKREDSDGGGHTVADLDAEQRGPQF